MDLRSSGRRSLIGPSEGRGSRGGHGARLPRVDRRSRARRWSARAGVAPAEFAMGPIVRAGARGFNEAWIVPDSAERLSGRGRFSPRGRRSLAMIINPGPEARLRPPPVPSPGGDRDAAHARVSVARAGPPRRLRGPERRPPGPVAPHADGNRGHSPGPSASSVVGRVERRFTAEGSPSAFPGGPPLPETRPTLRGLIMDRASTIARGSDTSSGGDKRVRPYSRRPLFSRPMSSNVQVSRKRTGRGAAIKSATARARVIMGP